MLDDNKILTLKTIFSSYPEIIAVYLFGSFLDRKETARDIDLAVLLEQPVKNQVDIYMNLYPSLAEVFNPLEPDLLFLHSASLSVRFEAISTGEVIYSSDDERRTDYEYIVSGEYMDFKYHLDMARKELFEEIMEDSSIV
jgi:predicted nucleotidyltransferase